MYGMQESRSGGQGNKHLSFKVQIAIVVVPVREGGAREEGGTFFKSGKNLQNESVRWGRLGDGCGED